jgi:hypothetical protein
MGMYTELIFGAKLKEKTPATIINALKFMVGDLKDKPADFPECLNSCDGIFKEASNYFGVDNPQAKFYISNFDKRWCISTRSNIKNYDDEIETFLEWIKPYIRSGAGERDMYAIVTYEESDPQIYYLHEKNA